MQGTDRAGAVEVGTRRHTLPPNERRVWLVRFAIVCAMFLGLLFMGAYLGIRLMIEAAPQRPQTFDTTNRYSRVLYAMPDGTSCRVVLFDNKSAMMSEGPVVPCDPNRKSTAPIEPKEFNWGRK